ncbi:MAG: NAD(P)(+) transhydrogenase (Re/Si-specific) subunit beta [Dehalococcoidia bacterium]|nr:NAD synthetase [Chloroflexota bacterium]MDP7613000.1 NAD(P)(+) transhydrogenase (Re/Si-specific) subunit beta [Dehalococcoidia bacterium]
MLNNIEEISYITAAVLFIIGLKKLSSPATARTGNALSGLAMFLAVLVTIVGRTSVTWEWIVIGVAIGVVIGSLSAYFVKMTAMPQMVAIFNGFGGGASGLVAYLEYYNNSGGLITPATSLSVMISVIIGAITFMGSFIAFGKLQGFIPSRPILFPIRNIINGVILIATLSTILWILVDNTHLTPIYAAITFSLILGVLLIIPIGGADMPVVVALLNSYSGIAAAATGFVLENTILIIAGSLVGASGIILTRIMTKAMNRSLANVMLGGFGSQDGSSSPVLQKEERPVTTASASDVAMILEYARSVIIVPGYGLAVAQAQHQLRELSDLLKPKGVSIKYAIHPVAGRMPGHMNVLLAEANVPYDELKDIDEINGEFQRTDVAIVVGANDVTNPVARTDSSSPIFGMPILNVDQAQTVIVLKRSMASGFAGVENELFHLEKTLMLFGDAKNSIEEVISETKDL